MKILYFNYHYDIEGMGRGAAIQVRSVASALNHLGHEVDTRFRAAKKKDEVSRLYSALKRVGPLRRYGHVPRLLLRNFRLGRESRRIIDESKPDVLLAVSSFCNLSALRSARRSRLPFILFCEAPLEYEYSRFFTEYHTYPTISRWIEGINVRGADQVICVSQILKDYLLRYRVPESRVHVVPNGVDHRKLKPHQPDRDLIAQHGLQGKTVVGFVGSFQFFTNVDSFAELVKRICDRRRDAVFLFVGEGKAGEQIKEAGKELELSERIIFTGAVPHEDVHRYLSIMDVVIAPYRGDHMFYISPMKPLEYMAAGKATLAPALGQIKELIVDGQNGILYRWNDSGEMGEKMLRLLSDEELRRRLGANARKTIEEGWTWELQASRIEKVLETALSG